MVRQALVVAFVIGSVTMLSAQTSVPAPSAPAFDVASVKRNTSGATAQSGRIGKGSVAMTNMRMRAVIASAYGIRPDRIVGAPAWFDEERFDFTARAPGDTSDQQLRLMLRSLLSERFRLVVRPEIREQPVYALVVARANGPLGPKLIPSSECEEENGVGVGASSADPRLVDAASPAGTRSCTVFTGSNGRDAYISGGARTIDALARALEGPGLQELIDRPVVERTGLTGTYDFDLHR